MNLARLAITRKTTTLVLTLVLVVGGAFSFFNLGRLEDPEYTIKMAVISTQYPGASTEEVEREVTEVIETAVQGLGQVHEVSSRSMRGLSMITVEIKDEYLGKDLPQIWDELRRKVGEAALRLPPGAGPPVVNDDFGDVFGIFLAISGDGYTYAEAKQFVDDLKKEMLLLPHVAKVDLFGHRQEAVYVEISAARMARLGIAPAQIAGALHSKNLVSDSGRVRVGPEHMPIDLGTEFKTAEEIGNMYISGGPPNNLIRLSDLAKVSRGYVEPADNYLRHNGKPAIGLGISIAAGGNVIDLGRAVKEKLEELKARTPVGMEINVITFQADLVAGAVDDFLINLAEAVAIVIFVLMIFMGLRSGLIIGGTLLITIAATFQVMDMMDINLQRISLGALVLALGMLVDNAIVVAEGMLIKMSQGMDREEAAALTVKQTALPLLGATIVAVLAFAALGLSNNSAGEYTASLYYVMLISLGLSWVLAVTLTPVLCYMFLKPKAVEPGGDPYKGFLFSFYRRLLDVCLSHRAVTVVVMVVLLAGAIHGQSYIKQSFFPESTRPEFLVDFWFPQGTHIDRTSMELKKMEEYAGKLEGVQAVTAFVGQGPLRYYLAADVEFPNPAYGQLKIQVADYNQINGLLPKIQEFAYKEMPDALIITKKFMVGPGTAGRVRARFIGLDPDLLRGLADKAMKIMSADPGARDIRQDWRQRVKVLHPVLAGPQAERNGIDSAAVAQALRHAYSGTVVGVYRDGDKLLPITLRPPAEERADVDSISHLQIWSPVARKMIPLRQVVSHFETQWEEGIIKRKNRMRTMEVICDPVSGTADALLQRLRPAIEAIELPPGYRLEWGGEYEDSKEANEAVFANVPLTTLIMVLVVIVLFNALRQPLIIFLCLPLTFVGVTAGLLATGLPMNFMAILGFLSLMGMVIKNSVVLIDQIDLEIKGGKGVLAGIKDASVSRARPVLMAAITTVLGMTPLVFDAFYNAMAVTIMSGLTFATLLTLIVVPVLYALFFKSRREPRQP